MADISNILIVEDNDDYTAGAREFFSQIGINPLIAIDYDDAKTHIEYANLRGALVDCFFPYKTGSGTISVGDQALMKMQFENAKPKRDSPITRALEQVGDLLGEDFAKFAAKNAGINYDAYLDHYKVIAKAMDESEHNQPLGILVGEMLDRREIPFVLATSTHHHDSMTQPIQDYASRKGWRLIDCNPGQENEKTTQGFWKRAYTALEEVIGGKS